MMVQLTSETLHTVTSVIGLICLAYFAVHGLTFLWTKIRPSTLGKYRHSGSESWALVTGASDGIGRSFADELLRRGFNVLLHGRNEAKLEGVRDALLKTHAGRAVDITVADASKYDDGYQKVVEKAKKLPGKLTVLVNNLGGVSTYPQYVLHGEIDHSHIDTILNVNVRFTTHLTGALIQQLHENGPSLVLNIGSSGGILGMPYLTTYSASKSYIHMFTKTLKNEMVFEGLHINVMGYVVGNVNSSTNTHDMPFTMSSQGCAAACLDSVNEGNEDMVYAHWKHWFPPMMMNLMPVSMTRKVLGDEGKKRAQSERKTG